MVAAWLLYAYNQPLGGCTRGMKKEEWLIIQGLVFPTQTFACCSSSSSSAYRAEWDDALRKDRVIISRIPPRITPTLIFKATPCQSLTSHQIHTHTHTHTHTPITWSTLFRWVPVSNYSKRDSEYVCERERDSESPNVNIEMALLLCFPRSNYMEFLPPLAKIFSSLRTCTLSNHTIQPCWIWLRPSRLLARQQPFLSDRTQYVFHHPYTWRRKQIKF